jgi:hypothetical protein
MAIGPVRSNSAHSLTTFCLVNETSVHSTEFTDLNTRRKIVAKVQRTPKVSSSGDGCSAMSLTGQCCGYSTFGPASIQYGTPINITYAFGRSFPYSVIAIKFPTAALIDLLHDRTVKQSLVRKVARRLTASLTLPDYPGHSYLLPLSLCHFLIET